MRIVKEDLSTRDYIWNNDSKSTLLADGPTRNRFDRFNGNCMLHIINLYDCFVDKLTIEQAHKIESLIQNELPLETRSEITVLQWLKGKHAQIFSLQAV